MAAELGAKEKVSLGAFWDLCGMQAKVLALNGTLETKPFYGLCACGCGKHVRLDRIDLAWEHSLTCEAVDWTVPPNVDRKVALAP